jgi:hypothetical protein
MEMINRQRSKPRRSLSLAPSAFERLVTLNRKAVKDVPDLFVSAKTASAIPVTHAALRDALIQASLDPSVRSIAYVASACVGKEQVELDAVVVERRDERRFLLDVVPARPLRTLEDEGLALIALAELDIRPWVLSATELRREPRYTNAQFVWLYNGHCVPIELRKRILESLDQQSMQLGHLMQRVRADRDPHPAIMSLACADLLELDLISQPLCLTTIVKSRG